MYLCTPSRNESSNVSFIYPLILSKTSKTGGTGYFSLSKAMTLSEEAMSEKTETCGIFFETAILMLGSVASCVSHRDEAPAGAWSWVRVATTTPSVPSSVSRRLSREFRLG